MAKITASRNPSAPQPKSPATSAPSPLQRLGNQGALQWVQQQQQQQQQQKSRDATWYVEMLAARPVVELGETVEFRLQNTRIDKFHPIIGAPRDVPVFLLRDAEILLTDEAGNETRGKASHRNLIFEATPPKPGKYRLTISGKPQELQRQVPIQPRPGDPVGAQIRTSIEFNVVAGVSDAELNAPGVRATAAADQHTLDGTQATDGEIAGAFQRLAVVHAFAALERNRQEALELIALYTRGADGKTGGQILDELGPVYEYDAALKRTGYLLLHDDHYVRAQAGKAHPEIDRLRDGIKFNRAVVDFQHQELEKIDVQRAAIADAFPALSMIKRDEEASFNFGRHPEKRREVVLSGLNQVLAYIEQAKHELATGKLSILDVQPILAETRAASKADTDPRKSQVIDKLLAEHREGHSALSGLLTLAQLLLLFVPGIGPFLAVGIGIANATLSWQKYYQIRAAAGAGVGKGIVDPGEAAAARFWAVVDSVFVVADMGAAVHQTLSAARKVAPHVPHSEQRPHAHASASERPAGEHPQEPEIEPLPEDKTPVDDVEPDGGADYVPDQEEIIIPAEGEEVVVEPRPNAEHPNGGPEFSGSSGGGKRYVITPRKLHELIISLFKRPAKSLARQLHFYRTMSGYERVFRKNWPNTRMPKGAAYRDPRTGHLHFSPQADYASVVHEIIHKLSRDTLPFGRELFGEFLDEGITEAMTRARAGEFRGPPGRYAENIAFVESLERKIGKEAVENAVLHGDYKTFRAAVKQLFHGDEARTLEFLGKVRMVDAGKVRNERLLHEVKAMLAGTGEIEAKARLHNPDLPEALSPQRVVDPAPGVRMTQADWEIVEKYIAEGKSINEAMRLWWESVSHSHPRP